MSFLVKGLSFRCNKSGGGGTGTKCGRWNPTGEQLRILTDLFRAGLRSPTTDQIHKISTQLSFYGKVESKSVFYWFQNHKTRERQRRRNHHHHYQPSPIDVIEISDEEEDCEEEERVIKTLQLFPVKSFEDSSNSKVGKMRARTHNQYAEYVQETNTTSFYPYSSCGPDMQHPPHLDLRLSFL